MRYQTWVHMVSMAAKYFLYIICKNHRQNLLIVPDITGWKEIVSVQKRRKSTNNISWWTQEDIQNKKDQGNKERRNFIPAKIPWKKFNLANVLWRQKVAFGKNQVKNKPIPCIFKIKNTKIIPSRVLYHIQWMKPNARVEKYTIPSPRKEKKILHALAKRVI